MSVDQTITTDEAMDLVDGGHRAIQDDSKHRWYTRQLVVFYYDDPATEEQEGMDVFEDDPVPVFPVIAHSVTTTVYKPA